MDPDPEALKELPSLATVKEKSQQTQDSIYNIRPWNNNHLDRAISTVSTIGEDDDPGLRRPTDFKQRQVLPDRIPVFRSTQAKTSRISPAKCFFGSHTSQSVSYTEILEPARSTSFRLRSPRHRLAKTLLECSPL